MPEEKVRWGPARTRRMVQGLAQRAHLEAQEAAERIKQRFRERCGTHAEVGETKK